MTIYYLIFSYWLCTFFCSI